MPIPDEVATMLSDADLPRAGYLFVHGHDPRRPVTAAQVSTRANRWLHSLGVRYMVHTLRHFYGTKLCERTNSLRLVQERMGHSSPNTTARYFKVLADKRADEIRDLPRWWREKYPA